MARNGLFPDSVTPGIPKDVPPPKGWSKVRFSDVLKIIKRPAELNDNTEYQLVLAKRNRGGIAKREKLNGDKILTKTQFYICKDDFLISRRQIIHGACGVVPQQLDGAIVSNEYSTLQTKSSLHLDFLKYYCHTIHFQQTCFQSSVGVDVEKMIFKIEQWLKYKFNLPPLPEQKKIAQILSTWDNAIELTEKLIQAKTRRKKGLMQQLLTGKMRFGEFVKQKGFKKTKLGEIPEGWKRRSLEQVATFTNGKAHEKIIVDEGNYLIVNSKFISSEGTVYKYSNINLSPLSVNDIAMVMSDIPNGKALAKCFFC